MSFSPDLAPAALTTILAKLGDFKPRVGLILGSGLGGLIDNMQVLTRVPYAECPGFFKSTVPGHKGEFVFGTLEGLPIVAMNGRVHLYEGASVAQLLAPIRLLKLLGCEALIATAATGSLRRELNPGSLVLLNDHLNLTGVNVLVGPNQPVYGPRFQGMENAYHPVLCQLARFASEKLDIRLHEGVYAGLMGPSYETKSEIRMLGLLGADVVGMSMVNEVIAANHCGLKVLGFALVTNFGAGLSETLVNHHEVIEVAHEAGGRLARLVQEILHCYANNEESGI